MSAKKTNKEDFKSGFVGLVGPTNSGKSTLLNALMGRKLSIVSPKAQTTYHGVRGVLTGPSEQMVLTDTPGFQKYGEPVARLLNRVADKNAKECDLLAWVFDASNPRVLAQFEKLRDKVAKFKPKERSFCILNKVDKIPKETLLPMIQALYESGVFSEIIPISAKTGVGVPEVAKVFRKLLPQGEAMYPADFVTDRPKEFLITEAIREKIYRATHQEVPYSVWIEIEHSELENPEVKVPTVRAVLHVDSSSRKGILIGKQGAMLKEIGTRARQDIEAFLNRQICLKLFVDVQDEWRKNANHLNRYLELV